MHISEFPIKPEGATQDTYIYIYVCVCVNNCVDTITILMYFKVIAFWL